MKDDDENEFTLEMCDCALCNAYYAGGEWLEEGKHQPCSGGWEVVGCCRSASVLHNDGSAYE